MCVCVCLCVCCVPHGFVPTDHILVLTKLATRAQELKQLDAFAREFGGQLKFEDTRADGNSDGNW